VTQFIAIIALVLLIAGVAYFLGKRFQNREDAILTRLKSLAPQPALPALENPEVKAVVGWLMSQAFEQTGISVAGDKVAYQRIVEAARTALETLKTSSVATVSVPFLVADGQEAKHFETTITREAIAELVKY